jgi:hypothetical protein
MSISPTLYTVQDQAQQLLQRGREEMEKEFRHLEEQDPPRSAASAASEEELDKGIRRTQMRRLD